MLFKGAKRGWRFASTGSACRRLTLYHDGASRRMTVHATEAKIGSEDDCGIQSQKCCISFIETTLILWSFMVA